MNRLILVYETEEACRARLEAEGFSPQSRLEISSYLAQSTDLEPEFATIAAECAGRGLAFEPVELDAAPGLLAAADPASTLVWTLTDGIAYFRGGVAPALARLHGLPLMGSDDSAFALCQDKFRAGAVMAALGLPCPASGLAENGRWIAPPPPAPGGWFVKPNRLGAKIGIWADSHVHNHDDALERSRRIHSAYGDRALVQAYAPGRNIRASFLAVDPGAGMEALGIFEVEAGSDFQTMADSLALYGETGTEALAAGRQAIPALKRVRGEAAVTIRALAARLADGIGLRDVFSLDLRLDTDGRVAILEFEVCPGLPCFDFRAYCRAQWAMDLAEAMAATAAARFSFRGSRAA